MKDLRVSLKRSGASDWTRERIAQLTVADIKQLRENAERLNEPGVAALCSEALDAAMNAIRPEEKLRLERNLAFLGTLGANAPFIGLFGSIIGIIKALRDQAESGLLQGGGEASKAVISGIYEALVATAVGLLVAIPAVVAYNTFQRRVKRILSEAEGLANTARTFIASAPEPAAAKED